ncbi:MAG: hypothetical protein SangKO_097110 [Sandaracinaceae bacterium]
MMSRVGRTLVILMLGALTLCVACTDDPDVPLDEAGVPLPASVELGTGTSAFRPIPEDGAELELVRGPQGGFHVFLTARITALQVDGASLVYSARHAETGEVVGNPASYVLSAARLAREGVAWVRVGDFLVLDDASPDAVRDQTLELQIEVMEASGERAAMDRRTVLIVDREGG